MVNFLFLLIMRIPSSLLDCTANCDVCANGTTCTTCTSGFFTNDQNTCEACDSLCLTCSGSANHCLTCDNSLLLNPDNTCASDCPSGYFDNSGVCTICYSLCAACNGVTNKNCTSCNGSLYFDNNGACVAICEDGYFQGSDNTCLQCDNVTASCLTCATSSTNCITCPVGQFKLTAYDGTSTCENSCGDGNYVQSDNKTCASKILINQILLYFFFY